MIARRSCEAHIQTSSPNSSKLALIMHVFMSRTALHARKNCPRDDAVADIQLGHRRDDGDGPDVLVIQAVPGMKGHPAATAAAPAVVSAASSRARSAGSAASA